MIDLSDPNLDPSKLPIEDKIELIRQYDYDGELIDLLKGEKINGDLDLSDCSSLKELPDGFKVGGSLNLEYCYSLVKLPDGLEVGGNLYLYGCSSLERLPDNLRVGRNLYLYGRNSLPKELPKTIKVGGKIIPTIPRCMNCAIRQ
jgi:hypothetical protein